LGKNNEIVTDSSLQQELALVMRKIYSLEAWSGLMKWR
jgi:hypothetical protein